MTTLVILLVAVSTMRTRSSSHRDHRVRVPPAAAAASAAGAAALVPVVAGPGSVALAANAGGVAATVSFVLPNFVYIGVAAAASYTGTLAVQWLQDVSTDFVMLTCMACIHVHVERDLSGA